MFALLPVLAPLLLVLIFVVLQVFFVVLLGRGFSRSFEFNMLAERGNVQRVFVSGVSFGFGYCLRSADNFLDRRLFFGVLGIIMVGFMIGFRVRFGVSAFLAKFSFFFLDLLLIFFFILFFEDGAAGSRIGFYFLADQILLGVNDAVGKSGGFFFADGRIGTGSVVFRVDVGGSGFAKFFLFAGRKLFGVGRSAGKQPAGQSATRAARSPSRRGLTGNARLRRIEFGFRFEPFGLGYGSRSGSLDRRPTTIFGQRFAGKQKIVLAGIGWTGRTRSFGAAIVKLTARTTIFVAAAIGIATATIIATVTAISAVPAVIAAIAFAALRRSVLGGRQIATSALTEITPATATTAAAPAAPETAPAAPEVRTVATRTAVTAAIITTISATIASRTAITAGSRAVLGRIVVRSKILGSRFVRFGLPLVFGNRLVDARSAGFSFFDMGADVVRIGFIAGLSRFERGGFLGAA